jgi:pimeloyl-ACP methyl ester carboxylesterase
MIRRTDVAVAVSDVAPPGVDSIASRFIVDPECWDGTSVVCCFAGGGMSGGYFELEGFDMSGHLAGAGFASLLVDHPGTGGSDIPDDAWLLTPEVVADVDAIAVVRALRQLEVSDPSLFGLGHSMGAMITCYQQARARPYRGLVLIGFSGRGLPEVLTPPEREIAGDAARAREALVALARDRFGSPLVAAASSTPDMLVGPAASADARTALDRCATQLLAVCGLNALIPGSDAEVLDAVDVPVLLALAQHDIVGPPDEAARYMAGSADVTTHVLPDAFHNSNVAPTRTELWDRIAGWLRATTCL